MLHLAAMFAELGPGVTDADSSIELRIDHHIDVTADRRADHGSAILAVEGGNIGPSTDKAHATRRAAEDHARTGECFPVMKFTASPTESNRYSGLSAGEQSEPALPVRTRTE